MLVSSPASEDHALVNDSIRCKQFGNDAAARKADKISCPKTLEARDAAEAERSARLNRLHTAWQGLQRRPHRESFELILMALPTELQLQVLSRIAPPAVAALQSHCSALHPLIHDLCRQHEVHLFKLTVAAQFQLESSIFPYRAPNDALQPSLWTSPDGLPWALYTPAQYLATLHKIKTLTRLATSAVQIAMPCLRLTDLIYEQLLYCWRILRYAAGDPLRGIWTWFATLPKKTQCGIDNFFNNLVGAFLEIDPVRWPVECGCMHARQRRPRGAAEDEQSCRYRVPARLGEELEALGVAELLGKQVLLRSVGQLLNFLWNAGAELEQSQVATALSWFDMGVSETFWDYLGGVLSHRCAHLPFAPLVLKVRDEDAYEVWIHGHRGGGTVELRSRSWREDVCRMLETAASLPEGEVLELGWFEEEEGVGRLPSFVVERIDWWEWEWWADELGLERLFS